MSVHHVHCTEGVTRSEGRQGANEVSDGIGVGGGSGDVTGDGDGAGTRTRAEAGERTQDGNGDGSGDGAGTRVETRERTQDGNGDESGDGNESSSGGGNGDGNGNGNEGGIEECGGEATKREKPLKSCRCNVGNGGDSGCLFVLLFISHQLLIHYKPRQRRQESVGSGAADSDNLENSKEAEREAQCTRGISKNCTRGESAPPLSRLIKGFRSKYY